MSGRKLDEIDKLLRLFPRPWSIEEVDPSGNHAVTDAKGRLLFYVSPDWDREEEPPTAMAERLDLIIVLEKLFK
jgi:hypothetical protein